MHFKTGIDPQHREELVGQFSKVLADLLLPLSEGAKFHHETVDEI